MSNEWIKRTRGTEDLPAGLAPDVFIEFRLVGDAGTYREEAGSLMWRDGPGSIECYRVLVEGVGDVNGTEAGSAARFNASKPDLSLIPARLLAEHALFSEIDPQCPGVDVHWAGVLDILGEFQMRQARNDRGALIRALHLMDNDGLLWADCARVFDYGREKYNAWNWARGQAWSIPIASALRHIVLGLPAGPLDTESGLPHRGHVACNIVMLLWFLDHYPAGDDRYTPPVSRA